MSAYDQLNQIANPSENSDPYSALDQISQTPADVSEATALGNQPSSSKYNRMCQQFVDDVLQTPPQNRQASASDAWNNYVQQGLAHSGTEGMQQGDLLYFQDPNDPSGHVGLVSSNGKFISATEVNPQKPVQNQSIAAWQDLTGQKILGFVKNPENLPSIH